MKRFVVLILVCFMLLLHCSVPDSLHQRFCSKSSYSLQDPCVLKDPYGVNPLVAVLEFSTKQPAQISLEVVGKNGAAPIKTTFSKFSKTHTIPVFGLYPNYNNTLILTAEYQDKTTQTAQVSIQTTWINRTMKPLVTYKADTQTNYYWLTDGSVLDENGETRFKFYNDDPIHYYFPEQIVTEDRLKGLKTYTLLGEFKKSYAYPKGFSSFTHGLGLTPSGNFLVIGSKAGKQIIVEGEPLFTQRDFIIEIDHKSGKVVREVDLGELLYPNRSTIAPQGVVDFGMGDWCHINGIDYDTQDDSWVVSCRNHGVMKITRQGTLDWLITPKKGLEKSGRDGNGPALWDKVLTAVDANGKPYPQAVQQGDAAVEGFKWPTHNHLVKVMGPNTYSLYDNSGSVNDPDLFTTSTSNAMVLRVDPVKRTVQNIWMEKLPVYSSAGSNVLYEPLKNQVVVYSAFIDNKQAKGGTEGGLITRYDLHAHQVLFNVELKGANNYWIYQLQPFEFYSENKK